LSIVTEILTLRDHLKLTEIIKTACFWDEWK